MAIVYAGSGDSYVQKAGAGWSDQRGDVNTSGSSQNSTLSSSGVGIYNRASGGRGATSYFIFRSYFPFDLSGESGTATSVTFNLYSDNLGTVADEEASFLVVAATALANDNTDYGNCFSSGTTLGATYSLGQASTTEGYATAEFNSGGISAVNSAIGSGTLTIGCLGYYDFTNTTPTEGGDFARINVYYQNNTGTSKDPYLDITYGAAATTDNATFFGTNF